MNNGEISSEIGLQEERVCVVCVWGVCVCVCLCVCVLAGETVSGGGSGREGLL